MALLPEAHVHIAIDWTAWWLATHMHMFEHVKLEHIVIGQFLRIRMVQPLVALALVL